MSALTIANEMALVNIQTKDDQIAKLKLEISDLKTKTGRGLESSQVVKLEE